MARLELNPDKQAFSHKEAAAFVGLSERFLRDLRKAGAVHAVKVGRRVIYARQELMRFIESGPAKQTSQNEPR